MITDIKDYIKVYNIIPKDVCIKTINQLDNIAWAPHRFYSTEGLIDNGKEPLESHESIEYSETLDRYIWEALRKYILEDINVSWFPGWKEFSKIKFIKYPTGSKMEKHCDHIHSLFDGEHKGIPILTVIGILNEDFEGGELVFFDDYTLKVNTGDLVIFPSVFLFPHRVEEIKKGSRFSFISWST